MTALITAPRVGYGPSAACPSTYTRSKNQLTNLDGTAQMSANIRHPKRNYGALMRVLAYLIAAAAYVWREQIEFSFSRRQFVVLIVVLEILSLQRCLFVRVRRASQPPKSMAGVTGFIGRHTLEIHATELISSPHCKGYGP